MRSTTITSALTRNSKALTVYSPSRAFKTQTNYKPTFSTSFSPYTYTQIVRKNSTSPLEEFSKNVGLPTKVIDQIKPAATGPPQNGMEYVITQIDKIVNWARTGSLW